MRSVGFRAPFRSSFSRRFRGSADTCSQPIVRLVGRTWVVVIRQQPGYVSPDLVELGDHLRSGRTTGTEVSDPRRGPTSTCPRRKGHCEYSTAVAAVVGQLALVLAHDAI